eukprot:Pgem_evm1s13938
MFALTLLSFTSMLTYTTAVGIESPIAGPDQSDKKAVLTQLNNALYLASYAIPTSLHTDELQTEIYKGQKFGYLIKSINGLNDSKVTTLFVGERKSDWIKGEHAWPLNLGMQGSLGIKLE